MILNEKLLPDLFYNPGDTFKILDKQDGSVMTGYVSGGQKTLAFSLPCDKSLSNVNRITPVTLKANVRATNGYIFSSGYTENGYNLLSGTSNIQCFKLTNNFIGIQISYTNTITNSTNNSTVSVSLRDFEFRFS